MLEVAFADVKHRDGTNNLADNFMDTLILTMADVTPPLQHISQLQSEMVDLKQLITELHVAQHQMGQSSHAPSRDREMPQMTLPFAFTSREYSRLVLVPRDLQCKCSSV